MTTIPDFMPVLSAGAHSNPSEGACVMEYVSMLAGEPFSDTPSCTHPVLARAAQAVNDHLSDKDRHLLVPLIGRLFGTTDNRTDAERKELSVALARWCANHAATYTTTPAATTPAATTPAAAYVAAYAGDAYAAAHAYAAAAAADAGVPLVGFLTGLLDEYDRLTGRTETRAVTPAELHTITVNNLVGASR